MHRRVAARCRRRCPAAIGPVGWLRLLRAGGKQAGQREDARSHRGHHASSLRQAEGDKCADCSPICGARPSRWIRANHADHQSVRRRQAARGVRHFRHLGRRHRLELRRAGPPRAPASRPGSGRHHQLRRQPFHSHRAMGHVAGNFDRDDIIRKLSGRSRSAMSAIRPPARPRFATSSRCSPILPRAASRSPITAICRTP